MVKQKKENKNKMNPILWFIFAIVIPVVIALILAAVIFSIAGVNVVDWAKNTGNKIPVLSSVITTDEEKVKQDKEQETKRVIEGKDAQIEDLNEEVASLEGTIEQLKQEIAKLEKKNANASKDEAGSEQNNIKAIARSFQDMDDVKAANIVTKMEKETAIILMNELSNEVRGKILGAMDPEIAADLTQRLMNSNE
ncbi:MULTISPECIES: hypothetical protein [unclassified Virgibacillus]|uniref:MotE family protein n=1 Tax=unclassified Virgibacillus TaxID=2620237 RepID=UPI0024DE7C68|nr:hypothetical protein [Virgibacillus sp. LDC-1]